MFQSITNAVLICTILSRALMVMTGDHEDRPPCPPLSYGQNCKDCANTKQSLCDHKNNLTYLHIDYRLFLIDGKQLLGHSIFERSRQNDTGRYSRYERLPSNTTELNDCMCSNIKRNGRFCDSCLPGYAPSPYTYYGIPCTECKDSSLGWIYYILLELGFPTIMFVVFLVFRVQITSGYMVSFVLYCQIIANIFNTPFFYHLLIEMGSPLAHTVLTVYGVWNMDFLRLVVPRFCVSEKLGTLEVLALGYVSAFYPLLLTVASYSLTKLHHNGCKLAVTVWKPLHRHTVAFRRFLRHDASLVDVFATFLLLSYSKILFVSLQIVKPYKLYTVITKNSYAHHRVYTSVDPLVEYMHGKHLYFAVPAFLILFIFSAIPPLIFCLYPSRCARRLLDRCRFTRSEDFAKLVSAFQDSYKSGENGTRDYRAVSAFYVVHRVFLIVSFYYLKIHDFISNDAFLFQAVLYILTFAFYSYAQPYKSDSHNFIELLLLFLLAAQSILNFQLYNGCELEVTNFKQCAHSLKNVITIQFCLLCIPQGALMISLLWLVLKKVHLVIVRRTEAHRNRLSNARLRDYTSLSLDK